MRSRRSRRGLKKLLKSDDAQWEKIAAEIKEVKEKFGKKTELGKRRTDFAEAPEIDVDLEQAMIEKEPVTVVCSEKGWIRALKGHIEDASSLVYKDGDRGKFVVKAETTDSIMLFASSGKFFTLDAAKLPGGRGHGEPVRLMADLEATDAIVALFVHRPGAQAAGRVERRLWLHRAGGRVPGQDPQGQAGPECEDCRSRRRSAAIVDGRCRSYRDDRRQPEAFDLQTRRSAGNDPRKGRPAAEIQGRRPVRCARFQPEGGAVLGRLLGPHIGP